MDRMAYLFFLALMTVSICVMGQPTTRKLHDVSLVYGVSPLADRDVWGDEYKGKGMFSAQYVLNASERFGIGAVFGYEHFTVNQSDNSANDFMAMFIVRATWIYKPDFTLYSKAGIGYYWMNDNDNVSSSDDRSVAFILPIPSIGATFSLGRNFFAMTEFSLFSTQGLLLFGAGYRF